MRVYKRGKTWWLEWIQDGKQKRISAHTTEKSVAVALMRQMDAARAKSGIMRRNGDTDNIDTILVEVASLCGMTVPTDFDTRNGTLTKALKVAFGAAPVIETKSLATGTPLDAAWSIYEETARSLNKLPNPQTVYRRKCVTANFVTWLEKERTTVTTVESVTKPIAAGYAAQLATTGKSVKTRKNIIGELRSVWSVLGGAIENLANPWSDLNPKETEETMGNRGEAFTRDEERRIFNAAKTVGKDWFAVCTIMRHTGLRYADVANLTWSQVDYAENVIHARPHKTARFNILTEPPILPAVRAALDALPRGNGEFLFPLHAELYGNRGRASREALNFREVMTAAGVDRVGLTIHSWRHTCATRLHEAGVAKEIVMRILGHRVESTTDRYDHAKYYADDLKALNSASA